jgi:copper(I)-binding protein
MNKALLASLFSLFACAAQAGEIAVSKPWVKGTLPNARSSSAYMEIVSDEAGNIIGASSPLAQSVELQDMRFALDGGPMRPTLVSEIPLEKRRKLQLTPVSAHFLLQGLKQGINAGDRVPLVLKLRMASGEVREVKVEAIGRGLMP